MCLENHHKENNVPVFIDEQNPSTHRAYLFKEKVPSIDSKTGNIYLAKNPIRK